MPVLRNPFRKNISAPTEIIKPAELESPDPTVPRTDIKTPAISILSHHDDDREPNSYQLCVVSGTGEYVPPSPPEKKGFWKRSNSSTSFRREVREALRAADNEEGFTISRESFDGYRRSFDISAKSPVIGSERPSLDSRTTRSSLDRPARTSFDAVTPTSPLRQSFESRTDSNIRLPPAAVEERRLDEEEEFKDIDLTDDTNNNNNNNNNTVLHPKKRGFLSRFGGGDHQTAEHQDKARPRSSTLTWKKDVHQGSEELGSFQPDTPNTL